MDNLTKAYKIIYNHFSDNNVNKNQLEWLINEFPKFYYIGIGYRAVIGKHTETFNFKRLTSWSKTPEGIYSFLETEKYVNDDIKDTDIVYLTKAQIEGFDYQACVCFLKQNHTCGDFKNFKNEDEVLIFAGTSLEVTEHVLSDFISKRPLT